MPYPHKLSDEQILEEAARLVDEHGLAGLSTRVLAEHLGARAPSLYRYFPNKERLVGALGARFLGDLVAELAPHDTLAGLGHAYWAYALRFPRRYDLLVRRTPGADTGAGASPPALEPLRAFAGRLNPARPQPTARAIWSDLHGAVALRLAWASPDGLDPQEAFDVGLDALERGLASAAEDAPTAP